MSSTIDFLPHCAYLGSYVLLKNLSKQKVKQFLGIHRLYFCLQVETFKYELVWQWLPWLVIHRRPASVFDLCWYFGFDIVSHWMFREKLLGMVFLSFSCVLFVSTRHAISNLQASSSSPVPSLFILLLLTFIYLYCFLLINLNHSYFFLWSFPSLQILITPLDPFLFKTSTSSLLLLRILVTTQTSWVFKISTLSSTSATQFRSFCHTVPLAGVPLACFALFFKTSFYGKLGNKSWSNNTPHRSTGFKVWEARIFPIKQLLLNPRKKLDLYTDYMISPDKSSW